MAVVLKIAIFRFSNPDDLLLHGIFHYKPAAHTPALRDMLCCVELHRGCS